MEDHVWSEMAGHLRRAQIRESNKLRKPMAFWNRGTGFWQWNWGRRMPEHRCKMVQHKGHVEGRTRGGT